MPKVYNKYHGNAPPGAINIMRDSKWGNRFVIGQHGTREQVVERFRCEQLPELMPFIDELRGQDLLCCCKPKACHGDVLLEAANR